MANKAISELPQALNVNNQDLFVLEQSGIAKKLTAETFITEQGIIDALAEALDGHGGITSVTLSSVSGRIRTYLITFTDETTTTFQVLDGTSIDRIEKTSTAGLVDTYTIFMSDGTTSFFQVTNGSKGDTGMPTDEQVTTAVDEWLDGNVMQETGYVLDRTLSMSNAAAPADLVGDLKNEVKTETEIAPYDTNTGKRVYQSGGKWWCWGASGSTVKKYVLEPGAKYTLSRGEGNVLYGFTNATAWNTELFGGGESTSPVEFTADGTYLYLYSQDVSTSYPNGVSTLKKKALNFATQSELVENTFVSGYGILEGWDAHAVAFSKLMADVEETEGFLYFTDAHFMAMTNGAWKPHLYAIMAYLEKLYYASPCSFVLNGGDWLGTGEPRLDYLPKLSVLNGAFRRNFDKYALLVGNHECGNQSNEGTMFTHDTIANTLLANVGRTYYTFDANTFKMYCFDSWQSAALDTFADEQIAWFAHNLESETAKHIVIALHILYDSDTLRPFGEQISLCAEAYNSRNTYTYGGTTYNFSSATGKIGFIIAGHEHADKSGTLNNIPYIITRNLTGYSITDINSEALPLDLMKVDWDNATLTAYRASRGTGGGTTRTLSIIS